LRWSPGVYFKTNARFGTAMFADPFVSSQKVNDVCLPCQSRWTFVTVLRVSVVTVLRQKMPFWDPAQ
jgi:hypothetical protein